MRDDRLDLHSSWHAISGSLDVLLWSATRPWPSGDSARLERRMKQAMASVFQAALFVCQSA